MSTARPRLEKVGPDTWSVSLGGEPLGRVIGRGAEPYREYTWEATDGTRGPEDPGFGLLRRDAVEALILHAEENDHGKG